MNYIRQVSKEGNVRSHFKKCQQIYTSDINLAIYMYLQGIQKLQVFDLINTYEKQDFVINFYGFRMDLDEDDLQKLYMLFIRQIDPLLRNDNKRKYSIVLFDCPSENKNCSDVLREMYRRLPAVYFAKLNKIYDIQPGFINKSFALINFTSWSKLFYRHVEFVQSVENVQQISQLKIYNILSKCPKQITRDIKLQCQNPQVIKSSFLGPIIKPFDCLKRQIYQYPIDQTKGVPLLLSILIQTMKQNRDCCLQQGIFRSAGSIEDQQEILKLAIQFKTFRLLDSQEHCKKAIAGVIKKIFTNLTTPLIPYSVYTRVLNQKIQEKDIVNQWKNIINQLPRLNKQILCYVTQFLREHIVVNDDLNKMNAYNLAVIFTPCFFRSRQCNLSDLINSGKFAALFKGWLQKYQQIIENRGTDTTDQQNKNEGCQFRQRDRENVGKINYGGKLKTQGQFFSND